MHHSLKTWMVLVGTTTSALAEDVTATTYYPSPRGNYQELRSTGNTYLATGGGNMGIGTTTPEGRGLDALKFALTGLSLLIY